MVNTRSSERAVETMTSGIRICTVLDADHQADHVAVGVGHWAEHCLRVASPSPQQIKPCELSPAARSAMATERFSPVAALLITTLLATAVSAGPTKDPQCTQDGLEKCGADLIIFASGPKVATNAAQLKEICPKEQASEKCARDYSNRCLPRLPKGMVTLFLDGVKAEVNGKCKEGHAKNKDYLKHATCMNDQGAKLHGCMSQLVAVLDQTVSKGFTGKDAQKKQLKESCCSFGNMRTCMTDAVKTPCGADTSKYVDTLIQGYAGDLLDTVCSAFPMSDCKATQPIKIKQGAPKNLLSPLAHMVSSLQAQG